MPTIFHRNKYNDALRNIDVLPVAAERHSARLIGESALINQLDLRFAETLRLSQPLSMLAQSLEAEGFHYCVFGGWVRDMICEFQTMPVMGPPRDIDLVVHGIEIEELLTKVSPNVRPTIFGGIQSTVEPVAFDVWPLHETFLIQYLQLSPTFESLLQSTDFNINSGLFFPRQGKRAPEILDGGMLEALNARAIAFNGALLPFPVMQCARLAAYAGKLSFNLSAEVRAFMEGIVADPTRLKQVLIGLDQNFPANVANCARQVLERLTGVSR